MENLKDLLYEAADKYKEKIFIKDNKGSQIIQKSFIDLKNDSDSISNYLADKYTDEIHVGIIGKTSYEYVSVYFGTVNSSNVIVPIDAQLSVEDICDTLNKADIDVLFYDENFANIIPELYKNCTSITEFININSIVYEQILLMNLDKVEKDIDSNKCCTILYTSGTTGKSKGVMLSNQNLISNTMCMDNESSTEEVLLSILPIHHAYCFTCDILLSLRYGATVCINDSLMHLAKNLQIFKPTIMLVVPMVLESMYYRIKDAVRKNPDLDKRTVAKQAFGGNIKIIYSGGAYLKKELIKAFKEFEIEVQQGYGMTECSPRIATGFTGNTNLESVGRLVNGCRVRIVDGEIEIKSKSVMIGYYKDEIETKKTITKDGWLKTGDLGQVDNYSYLYLTGRKKNLIILSNGENVSPEEIENKFTFIPLISEIVVYANQGVITAQIYPNYDYAKTSKIENIEHSIQEIVDKVNDEFSNAKKIKKVIIRDTEFEKTTTRKIRRNKVVVA